MNNEQLINEFDRLVSQGKLADARNFYANAETYADDNIAIGQFGRHAVSVAMQKKFALPDWNVAWPADFQSALSADSQPAAWVV